MSRAGLQFLVCTHQLPNEGFAVYDGYCHQSPQDQVKIVFQESSIELISEVRSFAESQRLISHSNILQIIEVSDTVSDSGRPGLRIITDHFSRFLDQEVLDRFKRKEYWTDQVLCYHLSCLASALLAARSKNLFAHGLCPVMIVQRLNVFQIDFTWTARMMWGSEVMRASAMYWSPEMKAALIPGQEQVIDYEKAEVYSLAVVLLFMARLRPPVELASGSLCPALIQSLLTEIQMQYPSLTSVLFHMLDLDPATRVGLTEVVKALNPNALIEESGEGYVSLGKVDVKVQQQAEFRGMCSFCHAEINSFDWASNTPKDLLRHRGEFANFCSLRCLRLHVLRENEKQADVPCVLCPTHISIQVILDRGVTVLPCGHPFHSNDCFKAHLEHCIGGDFICPLCEFPIPSNFILEATNADYFESLRKKVQFTWCNCCYKERAKRELKECNHRVCKSCWKSANGLLQVKDKCPVCVQNSLKKYSSS